MSHAAFRQAIRAEPDDDTPRLVYADWLDEQGEPASVARAEFIRAQIELAHLEPWTERALHLCGREQLLLDEHGRTWGAELPEWARPYRGRFVRGFPYTHTFTVAGLEKHLAGLAKNTTIQDIELERATETAAHKLAANKHLARIRAFETGADDLRAMDTVLASAHLTGLREWRFDRHGHYTPFTATDWHRSLSAPAVRRVQRLSVRLVNRTSGATIAEQVSALAETPFPELRELDFGASGLADRPGPGVGAVFRAPLANTLTAFCGKLTGEEFAALGAVGERPALKSLTFNPIWREQEWLADGFAAPLLRHVVALEVIQLQDAGFRALIASPIVEQLRALHLYGAHVSAAVFREGAATGRLRNLISLAPGVANAGNDVAALLRDVTGLDNLRHFDMTGVRYAEPLALDALAANPHLPNLNAITVARISRGQDDFAHLKVFTAKYAGRFTVRFR